MSASESAKISAKISVSARPSLLRRLGGGIGYCVPSILVLLALVVFWQLAVDLLQVKEYILPSPLAALKALARPNYPRETDECCRRLHQRVQQQDQADEVSAGFSNREATLP